MVICTLLSITATAWGASAKTVKLTLEQAIENAVKNDRSLKLLDEKIKLAERRYNMAVAASKVAPEKYWATEAEHISNKYEELLYPLQRELDVNDLKWQRKNSEEMLKTDVAMLYFQILQSQKSIKNQNSIIVKSEKECDAIKKKVKTGLVAESVNMSYEIAVNSEKTALKVYERNSNGYVASFNQKVGQPLDTEVSLVNIEFQQEYISVESIDKLVEDVLAESHDIKKLETNKLINKAKYDILCQYSYDRPDECETLEDSLLNSDYSIRDQKASVELNTRQDYNNILNLKDEIDIKQMNYNQKKKQLEISKKKYDLGMNTYLDYLSAQNDTDTAGVELNKAQLDYYKAVQAFKMYIDPVELVVKQ